MNVAERVFARTFNVLYRTEGHGHQHDVQGVPTRVHRAGAPPGNGFNLDIELVCKIVRNGYDPLEVPVNYVARELRGGEEGHLPGRRPLISRDLPVPRGEALSIGYGASSGGP